MLGNECPECSVRLRNDKCPECGWSAKTAAPAKVLPPAYRVLPDRKLERAAPTDRCPECGKTVAEHIAEFKRAGGAIGQRLTETR